MSKGQFLEGFVIGGLLGIVGGLLIAPQTGEETRKRLVKIGQDKLPILQDSKETTETLISKTKEAIETGFSKLHTLIEENKTANKT